jgi:GNAT superfamily N-acetyltransferase
VSGFHLRPARPLDAGATGAILSAFIDETPWMPRLHTRAEDVAFAGTMIDRGWVTVADAPDGVAGFVAREGAEIHALYVAPERRRQGCGGALIRAMQGAAARLTLWTFEANVAARAFYAGHGFAEVERTGGSRNDEGLPDVRLVWEAAA